MAKKQDAWAQDELAAAGVPVADLKAAFFVSVSEAKARAGGGPFDPLAACGGGFKNAIERAFDSEVVAALVKDAKDDLFSSIVAELLQ